MPRLVIRQGARKGAEFEVGADNPLIVIGRKGTCAIQILDQKASREHAEVRFEDGRLVLRDLESRNGTWLNGDRVDSPRQLRAGDRIRIGDTLLEVEPDIECEIEDAEEIEEAEEAEEPAADDQVAGEDDAVEESRPGPPAQEAAKGAPFDSPSDAVADDEPLDACDADDPGPAFL
jgi:pSer/pThr/pTyr-binding forkhead associated (FHA) protein